MKSLNTSLKCSDFRQVHKCEFGLFLPNPFEPTLLEEAMCVMIAFQLSHEQIKQLLNRQSQEKRDGKSRWIFSTKTEAAVKAF